jgi:hypothetical protein
MVAGIPAMGFAIPSKRSSKIAALELGSLVPLATDDPKNADERFSKLVGTFKSTHRRDFRQVSPINAARRQRLHVKA